MTSLYYDEGATPSNDFTITTSQNVTAAADPTEILSVDVDDGLMFQLLQYAVATGSSVGIPLYMNLRDAADNVLPTNSVLDFQVKLNGETQYQSILETRIEGIGFWNRHTLSEQQNKDYIDGAKVKLAGSEVNVRDIDSFRVVLDSSTQIDWSNSTLIVDSDAVEVASYGG